MDAKTTAMARSVFGGASVVLVANEINLSIFKPIWLGQTKILRPDELAGDCVISPGVVQIPTAQFNLLVLPNQLQMAFAEMDDAVVSEPLNRVLGGILMNLPHTPFAGLGINFDFFVGPNDLDKFADWNKNLFASRSALAVCENPADKLRFGAYFSLDFEGMRLKINVRPIKGAVAAPKVVEQLQTATEWVHFNFNYHADLNPAAPAQNALEALRKWSLVAAKTRAIIAQIPG
ncbi:MAG TPA: hypothetical protein VFW05_13655 [Verrucomicrobiae bacterium]|nr:hypothetical protein [Verrucomicrobiae bacterium]